MLLHIPTIEAKQNIQVLAKPKVQNNAKTTKPNKIQNVLGFQNASSKKHSSMHLQLPKQKIDSLKKKEPSQKTRKNEVTKFC